MRRISGFLTTDQNRPHQQNLSVTKMGIVVLSTTKWPKIKLAMDMVAAAVNDVKIGEIKIVQVP